MVGDAVLRTTAEGREVGGLDASWKDGGWFVFGLEFSGNGGFEFISDRCYELARMATQEAMLTVSQLQESRLLGEWRCWRSMVLAMLDCTMMEQISFVVSVG